MYDHGAVQNQLVYDSFTPPAYDISKLKFESWLVVSGANDKLSTPKMVENLLNAVYPRPIGRVTAPAMNHLDLIAGFDNDVHVNLPIVEYFKIVGSVPKSKLFSTGRSFDIGAMFPKDWNPLDGIETSKPVGNYSTSREEKLDATLLEPAKIVESLQRSLGGVAGDMEKNVGDVISGAEKNLSGIGGALSSLNPLESLNQNKQDKER